MEIYRDSRNDAIKNTKRSDDARAIYYEIKWGDRHNYDLIINSSVGLKESADLICKYVSSFEKDGYVRR